MSIETKNAPPGRGASHGQSVQLAGTNKPQYTPATLQMQAAVFLSRRYGLSQSLALTVAELAGIGGAA